MDGGAWWAAVHGETESDTTELIIIIIARDFSTPLSVTDRSHRQKISECIVKLKSTINQLNIMDICVNSCGSSKNRIYVLLKLTWNIY